MIVGFVGGQRSVGVNSKCYSLKTSVNKMSQSKVVEQISNFLFGFVL